MIYVPPNGFIGAGQQTQATQLIGMAMPRSSSPRRRKRKTAKRAAPRRRTAKRKAAKRASKRPARLVKGSAAAKRYMASIRRKRKR